MPTSLADIIVILHFVWIGFVLAGQLLIILGILLGWRWIRNFTFRFVHLLMILLVALESMFAVPCPLTVWERYLRGFTSSDTFHYTENDSFIAQWVGNIIFVDSSSGPGALSFLAGYLAFAALVVWSFIAAPPKLPMSPTRSVALIHLLVGLVFTATLSWHPTIGVYYPGIGLFFLLEAYLWYRLGDPRPSTRSDGDAAPVLARPDLP